MVCMAVFAGQVAGSGLDLKKVMQIGVPFAFGNKNLTLEQALKKALPDLSDNQETIFKAAFHKDKDEVMKRLGALYTFLSNDQSYKNRILDQLNQLRNTLTQPNPNADAIWSALTTALNALNLSTVSQRISELANMIPSEEVRKAIIESMVDDPEGFKKELNEVLELCSVDQAKITEADGILYQFPVFTSTTSEGSDKWLKELTDFGVKQVTDLDPLMNLINQEQKSDDIKYYIIVNSQIRKLDADLQSQGEQDHLKTTIVTMVESMISDIYKPGQYDYLYEQGKKLIKLYDEIKSKPITFVVKKWMLSTVLEKMGLFLLSVLLPDTDKNHKSFSLLKARLQIYAGNLDYPESYQDVYGNFREREQDFDSYIGERYIDGLYMTTDRAIKTKTIATDDLEKLGTWLVEVRIKQIYKTSLDKIFEKLKSDAEYINNTLNIKSPELFRGMLNAIKTFLNGRSFNDTYGLGARISLEDQNTLKQYGADVKFHALNPVAEYASTATKVVETITHIEQLRAINAQTTKPA